MAGVGDQIVEVLEGSPERGVTCSIKARRKFGVWWKNVKSLGNMVGLNSSNFQRIVGGNQKLYSKNGRLAMLSVIGTSVDSLFFYVMLVDDDRSCIGFDHKLRTTAVILRSIVDFLYVILTVYCFHVRYPLLNYETDGFFVRARKFFSSSSRVDVLAVVPLPQFMALFVIPRSKGLKFIYAIRAFNYILLIQYLSRIIRIYSYLKKCGWSTFFPQVAEAKAIFNLVLYMLASHIVGAFWYLSTIERKTMCWLGRCQNCRLNCNYVLGIANNADSFCSADAGNGSKTFDFGLFKDALPILDSKVFIRKVSFCLWWGLQKLSSFGQDLKTSGHLSEIYLAITITISGLVLFALLIGNLQTYLQSTITSLEKIRLKEREIEDCMTKHSIPWELKRQIRKCKKHKQRENKGVEVEQLLQNLPKHISKDIKEYLSSSSPLKVLEEKLGDVDGRLLDAIYDLLKPKRYIEQTVIVREGGLIDEVVFIIQGKVMVNSKSQGESKWLTKGEFYGEELVDWAFDNPTLTTLPTSNKTIYALSEVQVFALVVKDLKTIVSKFWWLISRNRPQGSKEMWTPMAASAMQSLWRRNR